MLRSLPAATSLVVCSTCRFSKEAPADPDGRQGGALFTQSLRTVLTDHACRDRVEVETMPCLFACTNHCTVFVRSERRLGYILGRFLPTHLHAAALLDYVAKYLDTADGVVPYAKWPDGVKGHFLVRVPPEGFVWNPIS